MNRLYKILKKALKHNKKQKNFNLIIFVLLFMFLFVSFILCYFNNKVDDFINNDSNKELFVFNKIDINFDYKSIEYDFNIEKNFDNKNIFIISSEFEEENNAIKINKKTKYNVLNKYGIDLKKINVIYDDSFDENIIIVNQTLSESLFKNFENGYNVDYKVVISNYKDIDKIVEYFNKNNIEYNFNFDLNKYNVYLNFSSLVKYIYVFVFIVLLIIFIIFIFLFFNEQNKNIKIFKILGYSRFKVLKVYYFNIVNIFLIILILELLFTSIFIYLTKISVFNYLLSIIYFVFILLLIFFLSIYFLLNYKYY